MRIVVRDELARTLGYGVAALLISALASGSAASAADDHEGRGWKRLWHPAFEPAVGARVEMHGLRWLGDRFAITGGDDHGAVVWWSQDGIEWTRSPQSESTKYGHGTSIDGKPGSYVMIGGSQGPWDGGLWLSDDGIRWESADFDLPSAMSSVVRLENGTFALYGDYWGTDEADERGCWMATSDDEGVSWQVRWGGEWDPGVKGACVYGAFGDSQGLVGMVERGISVSQDGLTWEEVVPWQSIRKLAKEAPSKVRMVGLMPYDGTTFILGGSGTTTLVWSRDDGLALAEGILDWKKPFDAVVVSPDQLAVAIRGPAPMVWPPTDTYGERFPRPEPICRPRKAVIEDIAAMSRRERLDCFGGRKLTFDAWIPQSEYGGTCPFGKPYAWIICENYWLASGPGPSPGYLNYGFAPKARSPKGLGPTSFGAHVRVTGHFDDPAAARCPEPGWDGRPPDGYEAWTRSRFVDDCRRQFVVTKMRLLDDSDGQDT